MKTNLTQKVGHLFLVFTFLISTFYTNITPVYATSAPTLLYPANGSTKTANTGDTPPLGIPQFKWAAVSGATSYRLQISRDRGFTLLIVDVVTVNTSYTPVSTLNFTDGEWFWHVRVESPGPVSSYSSPEWSYTKKWATPTNLPTLVAPLDGSTLDFYDNQSFKWTAVTGAARYMFQLYYDKGGWATLAYPVSYTLSTSFQPLYKLSNGAHYVWRVVPLDTSDHQGTPSAEFTFTASYNLVPNLLEPAAGANPTFTPTFRWTAVRGAEFYRLQYGTSDNFDPNSTTTIDTNNTTFTPWTTIPNDTNYYWRVRAHAGNSVSAWNPSVGGRQFVKRWYIQSQLLTPTNGFIHQRLPLFSWAPVPGASYYKIDISTTNDQFTSIYDSMNTANTFYTPTQYNGANLVYWWRVTPYDGSGNPGKASEVPQYTSYATSVAPNLIYPLFYYPPDSYAGFPGVTTNPHEDRTVPFPLFIWNRVFKPAGDPNAGQPYADAYRIEVSTNSAFITVNWTVDTQNTFAAPTVSNPFTPVANTVYFWRVRPLVGGVLSGPWSQPWQTRFDSTKGLTPKAAGSAPVQIRPTSGFEFAEFTPMLEWFPVSGATSYNVEISADQGFSSIVDSGTVSNPVYAPTVSLAQRSLGAVDFGVYYWRVREAPSGTWSSTRRFQIAAQSQWRYTRTVGNVTNQLKIGSDPAGDTANANYDLTDLNAAQSNSSWFFGFHVPSAPTLNVTYALYLDLDHVTGSGATVDPLGNTITTLSGYQPEYAVYILQQAGVFDKEKMYIFHWVPGVSPAWSNVINLLGCNTPGACSNDVGGNFSLVNNYLELQIPTSVIKSVDTLSDGNYAVTLLSLPAAGGSPQDSVPSDPNVPGTGAISRFSSVTARMNLIAPPNNAGVDPTAYSSILPFFWDWPTGAVPWAGAVMKAYLDGTYTTETASYVSTYNPDNYAPESHAWPTDFNQGDTTYFWRVQPRYVTGQYYLGSWSQGSRFERVGFVPQNLQTSVNFATPTFSWDRVEGAESYEIQVDKDPQYGAPVINWSTTQPSYTPQYTLLGGVYNWHVRVRRNGGSIYGSWSPTRQFTMTLPIPVGLSPADNTTVTNPPTLCWTPLVTPNTAGEPVLAARKYNIQVSTDSLFSSIYEGAGIGTGYDNTEQSCWTPSRGYADGTYYWHVAMLDGSLKQGPYSATFKFIKQYARTTLVSPTSGSTGNGTPTFIWTPIKGAAYYKLEISTSDKFSPLYESIITENTSFTSVYPYPLGTKYYWRVAMVDKENWPGPFNTASVLLIAPTVTFYSMAYHDGFVLESSENSNVGGYLNSTLANVNLGDDAAKRQYRDVLSFSTGDTLPDTAVITNAYLTFKRYGYVGGTTQLTTFQGIYVDIKTGFFGNFAALESKDFEAVASKTLGPVTPLITNGNVYTIGLMNAKDFINKLTTGSSLTQIRLRFKLDDNNDAVANYLSIFSGNTTTPADRPQLVISYYVP